MTTSSVSLPQDDLGSAAQRERRRRILVATVDLASSGGFDAVQMRAVADRADVALGTLYRYFPSKIHLLVSALAFRFDAYLSSPRAQMALTGTPSERVKQMLFGQTKVLRRDPKLTEALTRAFMFADASAVGEIEVVGMILTRMLTSALKGSAYSESEEPTEEEIAIARVLSDVWLASLVSWVTGRASAQDVDDHVSKAVDLVLG